MEKRLLSSLEQEMSNMGLEQVVAQRASLLWPGGGDKVTKAHGKQLEAAPTVQGRDNLNLKKKDHDN